MSYFASTFHVAHAHKLRGARWADDLAAQEAMRAKVPETMAASARHVEEHMMQGDYLLGNYTIADMHLFALSNWFEIDGVDIKDFPKLANWRARMSERPAIIRAFAH